MNAEKALVLKDNTIAECTHRIVLKHKTSFGDEDLFITKKQWEYITANWDKISAVITDEHLIPKETIKFIEPLSP